MKKLILVLLLTGCSTLPSQYRDVVKVTKGIYSGQSGVLIGDCSGFENYKVRLFKNDREICVRIWNLEKE